MCLALQVDRPEVPPYVLEGHEGEVTGVAWCPSDFGQVRSGPQYGFGLARARADCAVSHLQHPHLWSLNRGSLRSCVTHFTASSRVLQVATCGDDGTLRVWKIDRPWPPRPQAAAQVPPLFSAPYDVTTLSHLQLTASPRCFSTMLLDTI